MDRFLSTTVNRIDAKGRVSVPAHFRAVLARRGIEELYALRSLETPSFDVGGPELLTRYEARIASEDPFLGTADDMSFYVHGEGIFLRPDPEGRIQMTDFIRAHTEASTELAFVGRGETFQLWEPTALSRHAEAVRARLIALRAASRRESSV